MNGAFNPKKALLNFIASHNKYEKKEHFNQNINSIIQKIKETNGKIAIISDFDFTLTRRFDLNDDKVNYFSTYCVFENFKQTSDNYKAKSQELYNNYHKFETDESLDFSTRNQLVLKWYRDNLNLIVGENLTKSHFEDMIDHSHEKFYFREGIIELFEIVLEYKISFYIISGGLSDIIEHSLKAVIPFYNLLEAPGQFIKHYSPNIDTYVFEFEDIHHNSNMKITDEELENCVVIDFNGIIKNKFSDKKFLNILDLSPSGDHFEVMLNLYNYLRLAEKENKPKYLLICDIDKYMQDNPNKLTLVDRISKASSNRKIYYY